MDGIRRSSSWSRFPSSICYRVRRRKKLHDFNTNFALKLKSKKKKLYYGNVDTRLIFEIKKNFFSKKRCCKDFKLRSNICELKKRVRDPRLHADKDPHRIACFGFLSLRVKFFCLRSSGRNTAALQFRASIKWVRWRSMGAGESIGGV